MRSQWPLLLSIGAHVAVVAVLGSLHAHVPVEAADLVTFVLDDPPPPPPPAPPPPAEAAPRAPEARSPAPVAPRQPRALKKAAAAGPRPEVLEPMPTAARLPDQESEVELPSGDGQGAGGVAESGDGDPGGGSGDGAAAATGTPPVPLDATRHASVPYTREAIEARVGGVVLVELLVDEEGGVAEARLKQRLGHGLDPLALATARRFRFIPAKTPTGRPVAQWIVWEFRFSPAQ